MKVKGMIEPDVHASKVGDVIDVKLAGGVKVQAMAVQQEEDGMIFCLVDCLPGEYPMNSTRTNEGGYEEVFPAQAGVIPLIQPEYISERRIPRVSGGDPPDSEIWSDIVAYSPRKRG